MHQETPFSLIVWTNHNNLPFPTKVLPLLEGVDWEEYVWNAAGLPIQAAKYTMQDGKDLYLSELPNGTIKVEKCEYFTGDIMVIGYFIDKDSDNGTNYIVNFLVTIVKGSVLEVKLYEVKSQSSKEYTLALNDFNNKIEKIIKISNSRLFMFFYKPWFIVVRIFSWLILSCLRFLHMGIAWIVTKLTPY